MLNAERSTERRTERRRSRIADKGVAERARMGEHKGDGRAQDARVASQPGSSAASGRWLRSPEYADRLGLTRGVFRQANSLRGLRTSEDPPDESEYMPVIRKFASLIAPPTYAKATTVFWSVDDIDSFEESLPAQDGPEEGRLVLTADDYAGWLSTNRARYEAGRALAEGRIGAETASEEVRDLAGKIAPPSFDPPGRNTYELLWHLADVRIAFEEGRAAAEAALRIRHRPNILTMSQYAEFLGVSTWQLKSARYYQRGEWSAESRSVTKTVRQLSDTVVAPPSLILSNQKRNEVWAIEDVERQYRLAAGRQP